MGNFINKNPDVVVDIPFVHDNDVKYEEELEIKQGYSFKHNSERQKQAIILMMKDGEKVSTEVPAILHNRSN